jgi:hypothetical protein
MVAHTMFFAGEIRKDQEYRAKVREIQPRELDLAKRLIETMAVPFEPAKFRDTYRERFREMIDAKLAGTRGPRTSRRAPSRPSRRYLRRPPEEPPRDEKAVLKGGPGCKQAAHSKGRLIHCTYAIRGPARARAGEPSSDGNCDPDP